MIRFDPLLFLPGPHPIAWYLRSWEWVTVADVVVILSLVLAAVFWRVWAKWIRLTDAVDHRLGLAGPEIAVGFAFVAGVFLDKVLVDLAGPWLTLEKGVVDGLRAVASIALIGGAVYFVFKAALSGERGVQKAGLLPDRPERDVVYAGVGLLVGAVLTFGTLYAVNAVATWLGYPAPPVNHGMLEQLLNTESRSELAQIILAAVVVAPLLEELVFRGLQQTLLLEVLGPAARWSVVLTAAAVFAVVHVGAVSWHGLPGLFVLGVVLGWLYERTGSLWPAILVHAGFNAINISLVMWGPWEAGA